MIVATCLALTLTSMSLQAPKWVLTLSEEFDGAAGAGANPKVWGNDVGGHGFGNAEWQSYTPGNENAFLDGKGNLVIEARKEKAKIGNDPEREYTSGRLLTKGKFSQKYGRFEARIKLPSGKGIWPAFWMMGDNITEAGWPNGGEIDIMEFLGHDPRTVYGTIHGPGYSGGQSKGANKKLPEGGSYLKDFHVFAVEWEPDLIKWLVDGEVCKTWTPKDVEPNKWVYDHPFFIILNVAVGGNWPGYPDASTVFPQRMLVDYVRVYKKG
ncbi:MAG: family 16 glycosylhydrolase [Fimbriimonas sp.]